MDLDHLWQEYIKKHSQQYKEEKENNKSNENLKSNEKQNQEIKPRPPSNFIVQSCKVYDQIESYERLLLASYEGFLGIHRFLPERMISANKILYFNDHDRRKFIEETALFISSIAKDIQNLNYQMEMIILDLHHNNAKMFYQQIVSQLLSRLNKLTRLWDTMQKTYKQFNQTSFRFFSYIYEDKSSFLLNNYGNNSSQESNRNDDHSQQSDTHNVNKIIQPIDQLALVQETINQDQLSIEKKNHKKNASSSSSQESMNPISKLENSFAQRYIDEIATTQKMKEYQSIAKKEKENLLKEAKLLHQKYNTEVIQSQQIENSVMNISSLVGEFATLIQSQTEIVESIGETTEEVTKSIKSADEELLLTIERSQKQQWNMMIVILFFSGLLLLLHLLTP